MISIVPDHVIFSCSKLPSATCPGRHEEGKLQRRQVNPPATALPCPALPCPQDPLRPTPRTTPARTGQNYYLTLPGT